MKLYARLENEKGKIDGMGGNERLTITITISNKRVATMIMKENDEGGFGLYNNDGELLKDLTQD